MEKEELEKILENLQKKRKKEYFCSEADFQFSLAWEIKNYYRSEMKEKTEEDFDKNFQIRLEYPITIEKNPIAIDILVIKNGKWFPIELKYKTTKIEDSILKSQGANNNACYDYWKDIERIEKIRKQYGAKFEKGYAIMLTNDKGYMYRPTRKDVKYEEFSLQHGRKMNKSKEGLQWKNVKDNKEKLRSMPIILESDYQIKWKEYKEGLKEINEEKQYNKDDFIILISDINKEEECTK